jgi:hypothetical protein
LKKYENGVYYIEIHHPSLKNAPEIFRIEARSYFSGGRKGREFYAVFH